MLLVNDEEWRTAPFAHTERFARLGRLPLLRGRASSTATGNDAVIVKRKAAARCEVQATGTPRALRLGAPSKGRSALLALAAVAQRVAASSDPAGPERLTAVPTILRSGEAFNVVPPRGRLVCDLRADRLEAFEPVLEPPCRSELDGVRHRVDAGARLAGHGHARGHRAGLLEARRERAGAPAGRRRARRRQRREPHRAGDRGSPSTASGRAAAGAHAPHEWVGATSRCARRAEVALALAAAILEG